MTRTVKFVGIGLGLLVLFFGLRIVDTYTYPFKADNPNFSDVERVFAKLQFPAEWKEISSSENRGLHGRGCPPLNTSGCFHKSRTFKVPTGISVEDVKRVVAAPGLCPGVTVRESNPIGADPYASARCGIDADHVSIGFDITFNKDAPEVSIGVDTQ